MPDAQNVPGSSRINMIKGLAYSPSAPCEWGMNIWQRTCTASLAFQPPRLLCDRAANYGSIIIRVPDDGTIQFSRFVRGLCSRPFTVNRKQGVKRGVFSKIFFEFFSSSLNGFSYSGAISVLNTGNLCDAHTLSQHQNSLTLVFT